MSKTSINVIPMDNQSNITPTITALELKTHLNETGLRISGIPSDGLYLCRATNNQNKTVAVASSKSLVSAIINLVQKTKGYSQHVMPVNRGVI